MRSLFLPILPCSTPLVARVSSRAAASASQLLRSVVSALIDADAASRAAHAMDGAAAAIDAYEPADVGASPGPAARGAAGANTSSRDAAPTAVARRASSRSNGVAARRELADTIGAALHRAHGSGIATSASLGAWYAERAAAYAASAANAASFNLGAVAAVLESRKRDPTVVVVDDADALDAGVLRDLIVTLHAAATAGGDGAVPVVLVLGSTTPRDMFHATNLLPAAAAVIALTPIQLPSGGVLGAALLDAVLYAGALPLRLPQAAVTFIDTRTAEHVGSVRWVARALHWALTAHFFRPIASPGGASAASHPAAETSVAKGFRGGATASHAESPNATTAPVTAAASRAALAAAAAPLLLPFESIAEEMLQATSHDGDAEAKPPTSGTPTVRATPLWSVLSRVVAALPRAATAALVSTPSARAYRTSRRGKDRRGGTRPQTEEERRYGPLDSSDSDDRSTCGDDAQQEQAVVHGDDVVAARPQAKGRQRARRDTQPQADGLGRAANEAAGSGQDTLRHSTRHGATVISSAAAANTATISPSLRVSTVLGLPLGAVPMLLSASGRRSRRRGTTRGGCGGYDSCSSSDTGGEHAAEKSDSDDVARVLASPLVRIPADLGEGSSTGTSASSFCAAGRRFIARRMLRLTRHRLGAAPVATLLLSVFERSGASAASPTDDGPASSPLDAGVGLVDHGAATTAPRNGAGALSGVVRDALLSSLATPVLATPLWEKAAGVISGWDLSRLEVAMAGWLAHLRRGVRGSAPPPHWARAFPPAALFSHDIRSGDAVLAMLRRAAVGDDVEDAAAAAVGSDGAVGAPSSAASTEAAVPNDGRVQGQRSVVPPRGAARAVSSLVQRKRLRAALEGSVAAHPLARPRAAVVDWLRALVAAYLTPVTALPMHEAVTFNGVAALRAALSASPRGAVLGALNEPHNYLACSCCPRSESLVPVAGTSRASQARATPLPAPTASMHDAVLLARILETFPLSLRALPVSEVFAAFAGVYAAAGGGDAMLPLDDGDVHAISGARGGDGNSDEPASDEEESGDDDDDKGAEQRAAKKRRAAAATLMRDPKRRASVIIKARFLRAYSELRHAGIVRPVRRRSGRAIERCTFSDRSW